jgi:hypothetical protein
MKIAVLLLLALFLTHFAFAQFFIVSDKDGYVNVRDSASGGSRIIDTLNNGHFIYFFEEQTDTWRKIEYTRKGREYTGYVYHDRLKPITDYDSIPLLDHDKNNATCAHDSVKVIVTVQKFDKTRYRFTYDKDNKDQIVKINGKPYCGTDGELPKLEYRSIVIQLGSRRRRRL